MSEEKETQKKSAADEVRVVPGHDFAPVRQRRFPFKLLFALSVLIFIVLCFTTNLPTYILWLAPKSMTQGLFAGIHQNIALEKAPVKLDRAITYTRDEPYPVYSYRSGVCFYFSSSIKNENVNNIRAKRLINARRGEPIAKIEAIGADGESYIFDVTNLDENVVNKGDAVSAVCQSISKKQSHRPNIIKEFKITPLFQFSPTEIAYVTTRDLPREQREFRVGR